MKKLLKLIEEEATHWAASNHAGEHGARAILDLILHWDAPVAPPTCSICGLGFAVEEGGQDNDCLCPNEAHLCECHRWCWNLVTVWESNLHPVLFGRVTPTRIGVQPSFEPVKEAYYHRSPADSLVGERAREAAMKERISDYLWRHIWSDVLAEDFTE